MKTHTNNISKLIFIVLLLLSTSFKPSQTSNVAFNKDKIILCTFVTPSHELLLNECLLPSIQDDFEIIVDRAPQECPSASFMKFGWTKTTKKKVLHVIDTIKKNMGGIMIFADVDIQFFGPIEPIIRKMLKENDFVIQKNTPNGVLCTGFFALHCNEKNLNLWEKTYDYMKINNKKSDQLSFNHILNTEYQNKITWSYLPTSLFMGGGTFTGHRWKPGDELTIPSTLLMHHANYTIGIKNKIAQLEYVKNIANQRKLISLHQVWLSRQMKGPRPSSFPYITADTFRACANHIIDYPLKEFDSTKVKMGDTIFVYPYYLHLFFEKIHPQIKHSYILLTHNSVHSIPADSLKHYEKKGLLSGDFTHHLDDEKLIAWFSKNATGKHLKLFGVPIGITNACYSKRGNIKIIEKIKNANLPKKHLLYMNFASHTNNTKRLPVLRLFSNVSFCYHQLKKPFDEYLQDMAESKFVLSPDGYGIECHRTWEAMYIGCIPIVKSGPLDHLYDNLPVLIVDDWNIITEKFLHRKYEEFKQRTFNLEKMYMPYWIDKIKRIRKHFLNHYNIIN